MKHESSELLILNGGGVGESCSVEVDFSIFFAHFTKLQI